MAKKYNCFFKDLNPSNRVPGNKPSETKSGFHYLWFFPLPGPSSLTLIFFSIRPPPGLLPVLGPLEQYLMPTLDAALLLNDWHPILGRIWSPEIGYSHFQLKAKRPLYLQATMAGLWLSFISPVEESASFLLSMLIAKNYWLHTFSNHYREAGGRFPNIKNSTILVLD